MSFKRNKMSIYAHSGVRPGLVVGRDDIIGPPCPQIIRINNPETKCGYAVVHKQNSPLISKTFCDIHRTCFLPLKSGKRCANLRRSASSLYCSLHKTPERICDEDHREYKRVCALAESCSPNDKNHVKEKKIDALDDCIYSRLFHHGRCIDKSVQDVGHLGYIASLTRKRDNCHSMLWKTPSDIPDDISEAISKKNSDTDESTDISSDTDSSGSSDDDNEEDNERRDIFYDATGGRGNIPCTCNR